MARELDGYRATSSLMDQVGLDHGLVLHAGARTSDGIPIVNLWPSKDGSEAAAADPRRIAALTTSSATSCSAEAGGLDLRGAWPRRQGGCSRRERPR